MIGLEGEVAVLGTVMCPEWMQRYLDKQLMHAATVEREGRLEWLCC